jgi:hypothetical protein
LTDNVAAILDEVKALIASFETQRKELVEKLGPAFGSIFQPFLAKYPEVDNVYFTAYTPYFNDGDPCQYNVHDLYYTVDGDDEFSSYGDDERTMDFKEVCNVFGSIPDEIIEQLFDEGKITITRDGVDHEEYYHD